MGIRGHGGVAWLGCVALLGGCTDPVAPRLAADDAGDAGGNEPADDAGVAWTSFTVCACDGTGPPSATTSVGWLCNTDPWSPHYCTAPASCPADPLPYASASDAGALLPTGPCHDGDDCLVRTREQCIAGTTG